MPSATDRAQSTSLKVLLYGLLALVSLVVVLAAVRVVFGLLWGLVGLLFGLLSLAVSIGFLAAIGYAVYWLISTVMGQDEETASATGTSQTEFGETAGTTNTEETDAVERLTERYTNGKISEAELERQLEHALDEPSLDGRVASDLEQDTELN